MENEFLQERLISALSKADDAVSRLDERVRMCPFRTGWLARQDFSEAVAWSWNAGAAVPAEDLNLHDKSMDVRMADQALRAAHGVVRARRKAATAGGELLSPEGAAWLAGRRRRPPSPPRAPARPAIKLKPDTSVLVHLVAQLEALRVGLSESVDDGVAEWLEMLTLADPSLPRLLQAAAALEGWRIVEPYPREAYVGPLLVAQWLRDQKRVRSHLVGLEAGFRAVMRNTQGASRLPPAERILFWLAVIGEAAAQAGEGLNRLELARQIAVGHLRDRRAHSHLGGLIELFLERPVVTAPMAAQRLNVSPQTARRLIGQLGGSVTEISGQARFRAWRL
jgi:hypothetical protein